MARTSISKTTLPGGTSVGVGFQEFTWTAADPVNYNSFASTGKEILCIRNLNADSPLVSHTVTLHKTNGKIQISIPGGDYYCTGQIPSTGWEQSGDVIWIDADDTDIEYAVLVLP